MPKELEDREEEEGKCQRIRRHLWMHWKHCKWPHITHANLILRTASWYSETNMKINYADWEVKWGKGDHLLTDWINKYCSSFNILTLWSEYITGPLCYFVNGSHWHPPPSHFCYFQFKIYADVWRGYPAIMVSCVTSHSNNTARNLLPMYIRVCVPCCT